jgi:hypothetical protein
MNDYVTELSHLGHSLKNRFRDDAVFVENQKKVFIVFGFTQTTAGYYVGSYVKAAFTGKMQRPLNKPLILFVLPISL